MRKPIFHRLRYWINERLPLDEFRKWLLNEEISGGASYFYSLGSASIFLLAILFFTGVWELFFYAPTIDHAYTSLSYLRLEVPFGWLAHGLHYWSARIFAVVIILHMIRTFIWGAYKKPREMIWIIGIVLLFLMAAFMFTGPILPWDKKGYWAGKIGMEMTGTFPIVGSFFQYVIWGSSTFAQVALSRMFVFHIIVLPTLLLAFLALHLFAFRKQGSAGTWKLERQKKRAAFWPEQIYKNALVLLLLFFLLISLVVFAQPPFNGMADPLDTSYIPKPEWIFLFAYQLLKYFPGKWEPLIIAGIPSMLLLILVSIPFVDRKQTRAPEKRLVVMGGAFLLITFISVFTVIGYFSTPSKSVAKLSSKKNIPNLSLVMGSKEKAKASNVNSTLGKSVHIIGSYRNGKTIYENNCLMCHGPVDQKIDVTSDVVRIAPSLKPIMQELFESDAQGFVENIDPIIQHGSSFMPPFGDQAVLTQQQIADVEAYILKINGVERTKILNPGVLPINFFLIFLAIAFFMLIIFLLIAGVKSKDL